MASGFGDHHRLLLLRASRTRRLQRTLSKCWRLQPAPERQHPEQVLIQLWQKTSGQAPQKPFHGCHYSVKKGAASQVLGQNSNPSILGRWGRKIMNVSLAQASSQISEILSPKHNEDKEKGSGELAQCSDSGLNLHYHRTKQKRRHCLGLLCLDFHSREKAQFCHLSCPYPKQHPFLPSFLLLCRPGGWETLRDQKRKRVSSCCCFGRWGALLQFMHTAHAKKNKCTHSYNKCN